MRDVVLEETGQTIRDVDHLIKTARVGAVPKTPQPHKLRVLFVEFATEFGGAVDSLAELVRGMKPLKDVEPHILSFQRPEVMAGLFPGVATTVRRRHTSHLTREAVIRFLGRHAITRLLGPAIMKVYALFDYVYGYYFTVLIHRLVRRHNIDVVHLNNGLTPNGLRAASWSRIPCVAHMRGLVTKNTSDNLRKYQRHVRRSFRMAVAVSEAVRQTGLEQGLSPEQIVTIYDPVDVRRFDRAHPLRAATRRRHGLEEDRIVVAVFGRVTGWKGQREFLQAATRIVRKCPSFSFLVVGDPSDAVDPTYWEEVRALGEMPELRGRVVFTGYRKDVEAYYHACDIVVHSSIRPEPFGRVVIEGMACSKPVVAMNEGGPKEIITDGVDGMLVPPRSIEALGDIILALAEDEEARRRLGERARETVERRFSPEAIARQVVALYA